MCQTLLRNYKLPSHPTTALHKLTTMKGGRVVDPKQVQNKSYSSVTITAKKLEKFGIDLVESILSEDSLIRLRTLIESDPEFSIHFLLQFRYSNASGRFQHQPEYLFDARGLLGETISSLNVLHMALVNGDEEVTNYLIQFLKEHSYTDDILTQFLNQKCGNDNTALHLAAFFGMATSVQTLIELGANCNARNKLKYRPVDCADSQDTRSLFQNLQLTSRFRPTPINLDFKVFDQQLLNQVVDQIKPTSYKTDALKSKFEPSLSLMDNANPVNSVKDPVEFSYFKNTKFLNSLESVNSTPELLHRSISSSPSSTTSSESSVQLLDSKPKLKSCISKNTYLRKAKLDFRVQFDPLTTLVYATKVGDLHLTQTTLMSNPDRQLEFIDYVTPCKGWSWVHLAVKFKQPTMLQFWYDIGINLETKDFDGKTALHLACQDTDRTMVDLILSLVGTDFDFNYEINGYNYWDFSEDCYILQNLHKCYLKFKAAHPPNGSINSFNPPITPSAQTNFNSTKLQKFKSKFYDVATIRKKFEPNPSSTDNPFKFNNGFSSNSTTKKPLPPIPSTKPKFQF